MGPTSSCGKPLHWSPIKQLRKGTGMKQKRMMRKTVPLMTPWDSGLHRRMTRKRKNIRAGNQFYFQTGHLSPDIIWSAFKGQLKKTTHTSFLAVLFRSIPYSLAEMKWSLKAGMSFSVAMQPRADMRPLITSGRTGTGDMFTGNLVAPCQTEQIRFLANLTLPPPGNRWTSCGCPHRGKNMSYRCFRAKHISESQLSKTNESPRHNGSPYQVSLRAVDAIICPLPGCLNSTSVISSNR